MFRRTVLEEHIERNLNNLKDQVHRIINQTAADRTIRGPNFVYNIIPALTRRQQRIMEQII